MKSRKAFFSLFVFLLVFISCGTVQAADALIEKVIYQEESGGSASVAFHLNGPHLPKVFALKGDNPRVVFDFPETRPVRTVPSVIKPGGTTVRNIRMGIHSDKTRVVIDLVPGAEYQFDQDFQQNENILTILLYPIDSEKQQEEAPQAASSVKPPEQVEEAKPEVPEVMTVEPVEPAEETAELVVPEEEPSESVEKPAKEATEVAVVPTQVPAPDALLSEISFEKDSNNGEMALFKLNGFYPPTVSGKEEGAPRVICDFPGTQLADDVKKEYAINGKYVDRIRVEQLADPLRVQVTLELIPNKNYDLQQVFFKEDNLFVIIVNSYETLEEVW